MADRSEHIAAFGQAVFLLHAAATANAHALVAHRGAPAAAVATQRLERTLDWLALLHATGTFENLSTTELFEAAIQHELCLAHGSGPLMADTRADHAARAQALVDAARRGTRLQVQIAMGAPRLYRCVYVEPMRPAFELSLRKQEEPYMRWRDGAIVVLDEAELAELRAAGDSVDVLFLDANEFLDLAAPAKREALHAELDRRLHISRAAPDRSGDSHEAYRLGMLLRQSTLLRALRDRLERDHPAAHAATNPIVAENRALLETALIAAPLDRDPTMLADPLAASVGHERTLTGLIARLAAEPDDPAGLHGRFRAVAVAMARSAN